MTRAEFLKLAGLSGFAALRFPLAGARAVPSSKPAARKLIPMFYGPIQPESDLDAWFTSLKSWGAQRWMTWLNDYFNHTSPVPFLADALPAFREFINREDEERRARHILRQAELAEKHGIEFWLFMPFPVFPTLDQKIVRRVLPSIFRGGESGGRIDMRNPRIAEILQAEIRAVKKRVPGLRGITFVVAEGNGAISLPPDDVTGMHEWMPALVRALDAVCRESGLGVILDAHQFGLTVGGRRKLHGQAARFPAMTVMEDISWPEEDMWHPFMGYIPEDDRAALLRANPVALKFILETEYLGQGVLPSVFPRWWKRSVRAAVDAGVSVAMGRTFQWDGGMTDRNFNRLNVFILAALCRDPDADEKELLRHAAREAFGDAAVASHELVELLWETEPVIKDIVGLNGVSPMNHSRFPKPETLDFAYMKGGANAMKVVSDLFQKPGAKLYSPLGDDLNNTGQWRWQNQIVARPAGEYLAVKQAAARWAGGALARAKSEQVSGALPPEKRKLLVDGYDALNCIAQAMCLYVQAADLHYRWFREKSVDDAVARDRFANLAGQLDTLAETDGANHLNYRKDMRAFAEFLRNRTSTKSAKK